VATVESDPCESFARIALERLNRAGQVHTDEDCLSVFLAPFELALVRNQQVEALPLVAHAVCPLGGVVARRSFARPLVSFAASWLQRMAR
jgi:hypothetical protein